MKFGSKEDARDKILKTIKSLTSVEHLKTIKTLTNLIEIYIDKYCWEKDSYYNMATERHTLISKIISKVE